MNSSFLAKVWGIGLLAVASLPTDISSNYSTFVETYYQGGIPSFEEEIRQYLVYPSMSKQRCEVGEVIVEVEFGQGGRIKNISFHNAIARPLNLMVVEAIKQTAGRWKSSVEGQQLIMSVGFQLGYEDPIGGDIRVKSKQLFAPGKICECTQDIEERIQRFVDNSQYKKALKDCLELLRRYPRNEAYQQLFQQIMDNSI